MKGQIELIVFIFLFIISIILFTTASIWGRGIFEQNVDVAKIEAAEKFLKDLDNNILNLIEYGGSRTIDYDIGTTIGLSGGNTIEVNMTTSLQLPRYWINLTSDTSYIREKLEGSNLRIQVIYPERQNRIEFFTKGPTLTKPDYIIIRKDSTYVDSGVTVIRIEISFMKYSL